MSVLPIPASAMKALLEGKLKKHKAGLHRIMCPYCHIGYCDIVVEENAGTFQWPSHGVCEACGKTFLMRVAQIKIAGSRLED